MTWTLLGTFNLLLLQNCYTPIHVGTTHTYTCLHVCLVYYNLKLIDVIVFVKQFRVGLNFKKKVIVIYKLQCSNVISVFFSCSYLLQSVESGVSLQKFSVIHPANLQSFNSQRISDCYFVIFQWMFFRIAITALYFIGEMIESFCPT